MGEFTDKDRERSQKTLTLLEQHVKLSDERHIEVKRLIEDHEQRLRRSETFRNRLIGWAICAGALTTGALESLKSIFLHPQ